MQIRTAMGVLFALWMVAVGGYWAISLVRAVRQPPDWRWPTPESRAFRTEYLSRNHFIVVAIVGIVSSALVAVFGLIVLP